MLCPIQTQIARGQEQGWFQAPSSTRGIFPSLKTLFQGSAAGARGRALRGGEFSQNHLDLGEKKTNNSLSSSWFPKFVPGFLEAQLWVLDPGSGSSRFVTNPDPVLAAAAGFYQRSLAHDAQRVAGLPPAVGTGSPRAHVGVTLGALMQLRGGSGAAAGDFCAETSSPCAGWERGAGARGWMGPGSGCNLQRTARLLISNKSPCAPSWADSFSPSYCSKQGFK